MQQDLDVTEAAVWSTADVAQLAELAEQLRWLARPHMYEAVRQPAMIGTVRELPADAPLHNLARAVAENALRRVVRAGMESEPVAMLYCVARALHCAPHSATASHSSRRPRRVCHSEDEEQR